MPQTRTPQNKGSQPIMLQVFIVAAVVYVVVLVLMYVFQRNFLYYPDSNRPIRAESGVADMDEVHFTTADDLDLFAWAQAPRMADKPWVVMFHGNAGTIAERAFKARMLIDAGYGVMLVEYRGYGGNPGEPTEAGLLADARGALAYLGGQGAGGAQLVLYGESLGTGVAVAMAYEAAQAGQPVAAVLLEAPFTAAVDVAAGHYPFLPARLMMKDHFDSMPRIQGIQAPLFVAHGALDRTIPQSQGRKLFKAAHEPKVALWLDGAGPGELFSHGLGAALLAFLKKYDI